MIATAAIAAATVLTLAGAAGAADLIIDTPVAVAPAASSWDGFYVGIFGGLAAGTITTTDNLNTSPFEEDYEGYLLGLAAGYNFPLSDNVVGGFQVDLAYNDASSVDDAPSYALAVDWSGSATARVGLEIGNFVPYVLGGISFASASIEDGVPATDEGFHTGYVLGLGGEIGLTDTISANLEYRYTNYGTQIYEDLANVTSAELADSSVRAGLNFRFN